MFPDNTISTNEIQEVSLLPPDDRKRVNRRVDFELGPIALNNTSKGLSHQIWKAWIEDNNTKIYIAPEDDLTNKSLLITDTNISEISFTFDQLARPQIVYVANAMPKLYWYDSVEGNQTTTTFPDMVSPMLAMDDKRISSSQSNDIILGYIKNGRLYYRQQRDRYQIERDLGEIPEGTGKIVSMGMSSGYRFTFTFAKIS